MTYPGSGVEARDRNLLAHNVNGQWRRGAGRLPDTGKHMA